MRVMIVDDDRIVVRSLATILSAESDVEIVAMATSGNEAVRQFREQSPDVTLMDIQMPHGDGLAAAKEILADNPNARVVFLTTFSDDDYIVRALRLGARGYLIKQDVATIAPALRSVMAGQSVLEGEVLARATRLSARDAQPAATTSRDKTNTPQVDALTGGSKGANDAAPSSEALLNSSALLGLTRREREVVVAIADGLSNSEVAARLYMSEGTVRNHISSILAKLDLRNRTQIAVYFYRNCL